MSEKVHSHEHHQNSAEVDRASQERSRDLLEKAKHEAAKAEKQGSHELEEIRKSVDAAAEKSKKQEATQDAEPEVANTYWYSREYREMAFDQLIKKSRKHLKKADKTISRLIHQPTVEKLSEVGEKTVGRPSGMLGGSIFSFITSLAVYFIARRNGYDMTYSVFIMAFLGGFILGVAVEFGYKLAKNLVSRS